MLQRLDGLIRDVLDLTDLHDAFAAIGGSQMWIWASVVNFIPFMVRILSFGPD